jgi:ABC-2 type transport system permease protein
MGGTVKLIKAELLRLTRNKRYFFFTLLLPVILYLAFAHQKATVNGIDFKAYYMVAMATFGALSGALTGNSQRIAQEKKDGWIRQLRLTSLPASAYVTSKVVVSMATTIPSIAIVFLLGRFYAGVHMPAWQWPVCAVVVWFGSTIFAALAVAIGYKFMPDQAQPVALLAYFGFLLLGGIWIPIGGFIAKVGQFTPAAEVVRISTDVISGVRVDAGVIVGLVVWLAVFVGLATLAVRSTAETL